MHQAVFEALVGQVGVGQQVAILLVAAGDAAGGFNQLGDGGFVANQRLESLGHILERVYRASVDLQLSNGH